MHEFKSGDKVERIKHRHNDMKIGDVDIVVGGRYDVDLKKYDVGHSKNSLRLVHTTWKERYERQKNV